MHGLSFLMCKDSRDILYTFVHFNWCIDFIYCSWVKWCISLCYFLKTLVWHLDRENDWRVRRFFWVHILLASYLGWLWLIGVWDVNEIPFSPIHCLWCANPTCRKASCSTDLLTCLHGCRLLRCLKTESNSGSFRIMLKENCQVPCLCLQCLCVCVCACACECMRVHPRACVRVKIGPM